MNDTISLIDASLLSQEKKTALKKVLADKGESAEFDQLFADLLEEEFTRRLGKMEEMDEKGEKELARIEKEYEKKRAELDEAAERLLKKITADDFDSEEVIMDQYEKGVQILQTDYLEKMKKVFSDGAIQLIKDGF
jgi:ribonucleotide reductase alpha subunit